MTLHIYDVGESREAQTCNRVLRLFGTGVFHSGVEVRGREWSFEGRGIFRCPPRQCSGHTFQESIFMGQTTMSENQVLQTLAMLEKDWHGESYDLLKHNCCHFCDELCQWLGVGAIPPWVTNLANTGAAIVDTRQHIEAVCCEGPMLCQKDGGFLVDCGLCSPALATARRLSEKSPWPPVGCTLPDGAVSTPVFPPTWKDDHVDAVPTSKLCNGCYGVADVSRTDSFRETAWEEEQSDSRMVILDPGECSTFRLSLPEAVVRRKPHFDQAGSVQDHPIR